jgi:ferric-dicitrate binding protein FerR (iron transport regulator)
MIDKKLSDRIERALEGLLSENEWQALQEEIVRDLATRAAYAERAWLHSQLRSQRERLPSLLAEPVTLRPKRWPIALAAATIAACLTLVACLLFLPRSQPAPVVPIVATLTQADNCKWAGSDLPTKVDSKLTAGTLSLVEGIATLKFECGATVTLEAPTTLEVTDSMHCRLVEGTVTAEVPEQAHGFTIVTPDIRVVDLGTRFGVTAGSTGNSQVRVFEGEVEIDGLKDGKTKRLTEGNALHVGSSTVPAGQEPTRGQPLQEAGGWTAIPTSFGQGKDTYVRRGDNGAPMGTHPLLIVKHSEIPASRTNERRAAIAFDVSQIDKTKLTEAQIVLDPEPSGFGFSALVPDDSRFAVYGLTDESLDAWSEASTRWASFPGCTDDGPELSQVHRLAEFWIPRGGSGSSLVIRGEALADFIRTDTNGLVSFLIVRETGETDHNGIAHGFASKEHPSARPPTLRFK